MKQDVTDIKVEIGLDRPNKRIIIQFGHDVKWIGLDETGAEFMINTLKEKLSLLRRNCESESGELIGPLPVGAKGDIKPGGAPVEQPEVFRSKNRRSRRDNTNSHED